jgi:hypothetical protein
MFKQKEEEASGIGHQALGFGEEIRKEDIGGTDILVCQLQRSSPRCSRNPAPRDRG